MHICISYCKCFYFYFSHLVITKFIHDNTTSFIPWSQLHLHSKLSSIQQTKLFCFAETSAASLAHEVDLNRAVDSDNDGFVSSDDLTDEEEPSVHFFNLLRGKILAEVNIEN